MIYFMFRNMYRDSYHTPVMDKCINLTVVLRREESGFGFRILGGNAQDECVSVIFCL